jgi:hypothetical protein
MLVNMKGSMLGYGAILAILVVGSFVIIFITGAETEKAVLSSREGQLISFGNYGHFLVKMLDQSVYFISQRSAYDLGKTGGIEGSEVAIWYEDYPTIEELTENLEEGIKDNLPSTDIRNGKRVTWGDSEIDITTDSDYFSVVGTKKLFIIDDATESLIDFDYEFDKTIDSSYFRLLVAGRAIMEDHAFNQYLSNYGDLFNAIYTSNDPRFAGLTFIPPDSPLGEGDIIEITIVDYCYPSGTYCLAPLKFGETGFNPSIPYDYVRLKFRYKEGQTGFTDIFNIFLDSYGGEVEIVCE